MRKNSCYGYNAGRVKRPLMYEELEADMSEVGDDEVEISDAARLPRRRGAG